MEFMRYSTEKIINQRTSYSVKLGMKQCTFFASSGKKTGRQDKITFEDDDVHLIVVDVCFIKASIPLHDNVTCIFIIIGYRTQILYFVFCNMLNC